MTTLGNITLLDRLPVGFLCSAMTASSAILPCLDWANEMAKGEDLWCRVQSEGLSPISCYQTNQNTSYRRSEERAEEYISPVAFLCWR